MSPQDVTYNPHALDTLRDLLPVGSTVTTHVAHVSQSGMSRNIVAMIGLPDGTVRDLSSLIIRAGLFNAPRRGQAPKPGVTVGGAGMDMGMDMGFHLVYSLSGALYGDGYALNQRWL